MFRLEGRMLFVGRDASCALVLPNSAVSRRHARLVQREGGWLIEDLDSPNSTLVNDQPIKRQQLAHGDIVRIARYRLEFMEETRLDAMEAKALEALQVHGRSPMDDSSATFIIPARVREKILQAERARESVVLISLDDRSLRWRPDGRNLSIGPGGDIPADVALTRSPIAMLEWDGQRYTLHKTGIFGRVEVNDEKVKRAVLSPGDRIRVGKNLFELREPSS